MNSPNFDLFTFVEIFPFMSWADLYGTFFSFFKFKNTVFEIGDSNRFELPTTAYGDNLYFKVFKNINKTFQSAKKIGFKVVSLGLRFDRLIFSSFSIIYKTKFYRHVQYDLNIFLKCADYFYWKM